MCMVHLWAAAIVVFKGPVQHCRVGKSLSFQPPHTVKVLLLADKGFLFFSFRALADAFDGMLVLAHQSDALCKEFLQQPVCQIEIRKIKMLFINLHKN